MHATSPAPLRTLNLCVTNLREDEYHFLKSVVAVLTDPMLARQRQSLRVGATSLALVDGALEIVSPFTTPPHATN